MHDDLIRHLARVTDLPAPRAERLVTDVVAYFSESLEELVARRHRELQRAGLRNEEIFERLESELGSWRVRPPELTRRQLRRLVYG